MRGLNSMTTQKVSIYEAKNQGRGTPSLYRRVAFAGCAGVVAITLLALSGCASTPVPTEQLAVSKTAVESATTAGGTEFAPLELKAARDKLEAANKAVAEKNNERAALLASEAQVDAKLAETKAESAKAQKAVAETQDNLRTMLQEVNRNSQQQIQQQEQRAQ
jgi:septal ring factor EnvC (AmiA/AmiB activator)